MICIYHQSCPDGFGAALAVYIYAKENNIDVSYVPAHYGDEPPDVTDQDVMIVDFSYSRAALIEMNKIAASLIVIDHHKTAEKALKGLDFCIFNMIHSGAVLTWKYLFPNKTIPLLLLYIQDRDLWRFHLDNSREVSAGLAVIQQHFKIWMLYLSDVQPLIEMGDVVLDYQTTCIKKVKSKGVPIVSIRGHKVPCVNATHLISELGEHLSKGYPFSASYFDTEDKRIYSLRSQPDGIDVSVIAKHFGGGGHQHAAGFSVPKPEGVKL